MSTERVAATQQRVRAILAGPATELVADYYSPAYSFAGAMFDEFGDNPAGRFTSDDIVAASLLDIRFGPPAVHALLVDDEVPARQLAHIPERGALWEDVDLAAAYELWATLRAIDGVGQTRASKLLARKRPHLMPILDSVIVKALKLEGTDSWLLLRAALADASLRSALDQLAPAGPFAQPSTLRLLDVATWMMWSEPDSARSARSRHGMDVPERP